MQDSVRIYEQELGQYKVSGKHIWLVVGNRDQDGRDGARGRSSWNSP